VANCVLSVLNKENDDDDDDDDHCMLRRDLFRLRKDAMGVTADKALTDTVVRNGCITHRS